MNSICVRLEQVQAWLQAQQPDLLLLQELKGTEFPSAAFATLGYQSAAVTQKTYNGVAILSRLPLTTVATRLSGEESDTQARYVEVAVGGINVVCIYLPNGNPLGTEKYAYKLRWMQRLQSKMQQWLADKTPVVIGGDFNLIPEEIDCARPADWQNDALFQPEVRAWFRTGQQLGYVDAFRQQYPQRAESYTYWDYFRHAFEHNRGIRIDHFLLSPAIAARLADCTIDTEPRGREKPSDHAPIVLELR